MKRLTFERCSGIKSGYWSPEKKDDLIQSLAAYENTGLDPEGILALKAKDEPDRYELPSSECNSLIN